MPDLNKLPKALKISDQALLTCLGSIRNSLSSFWDGTVLRHYTKHGIEHSEKDIKHIGGLLASTPDLLNKHERFILIAAAYLHDIGMQSPQHSGIKKKSQYSAKDMEAIRDNHHEASAAMIRQSITKKGSLDFGLSQCSDYVDLIAEVARHHRKLELSELEDGAILGNEIRLSLLGALLKLGDELDQDYERVNLDILKRQTIPAHSKFHWWSHHFVQSLLVKKGKIEIHFRFPEKYEEDKRIVDVFKKKVLESVKNQLLKVYVILFDYKVNIFAEPIVKKVNYVSEGVVEPIPGDLKRYIENTVLKAVEGVEAVEKKTGVAFYVGGSPYSDNAAVAESLARIVESAAQENYAAVIEEVEHARSLIMSPKDRMVVLINAGICHYKLGDSDSAERDYREALAISRRADLVTVYGSEARTSEGNALGNIGLIYRAKGEPNEALEYFKDALKIHREIRFKLGEANQLCNIGLIYSEKGEPNEALEYFENALKIHREIGYGKGEAIQLGNIGLIYSDKGKQDEALNYLNEALEIDREIGYKQGEADNLGNIGVICRYKGEPDKALKYLKDALKIDREIGHKLGVASGIANIGLIYSDKGEQDEALKCFREALGIVRTAAPGLVWRAFWNMADAYVRKVQYEKAFEFFGKSLASSTYPEQMRGPFLGIRKLIHNLSQKEDWKNLEKIQALRTTKEIVGEGYVKFFNAVYEYAKFRQTSGSKQKKKYTSARSKLDSEHKKIFDEIFATK